MIPGIKNPLFFMSRCNTDLAVISIHAQYSRLPFSTGNNNLRGLWAGWPVQRSIPRSQHFCTASAPGWQFILETEFWDISTDIKVLTLFSAEA
jgi:hypothetical protein